MTGFDYTILGFYFAFLIAISWAFRHLVRNVSDYFRSGGQVLWWMVGGSAFMLSFSAWTFTGAASRAYSDGWPIMMLYVANAVGFMLNALYFAPRFRQLRVITAMQAVRARFGPGNEQFFTWMTLPIRILYAGIWLFGLGVFFSAAFQLDQTRTILLAGGTVILIALISGSWAVVASDFIQVLVLMPVTMVATVLAVSRLGGVSAFVHRLPAGHLDFSRITSNRFLLFWCVAILFKQIVSTNNLTEAYRYLAVKDSRQARKAAALASVLMLLGIVIWFVPPMAASVTDPDIALRFPALNNPAEGSFFAIALRTFPVGMVGLLVSGVFAATMSAMDAGLNSNAGIFIKNFYQPVLRPGASDRELLVAGKITTVALGLTIIGLAQTYSHIKHLSLFQLMLDFGILVALPQSIPLVLAIFIRRTPAWAGWSTVLVGFATSLVTRHWLTLERAVAWFGGADSVDRWARQNWDQAIAVVTNLVVCTAWFCSSRLFYRRTSADYQARIEAFSATIERPLDYDRDEAATATDDRQSWLIGWLCIPYGAVICLMAFIPNPLRGRLCFVFCGLVLEAIGTALVLQSRRQSKSRSRLPRPEEVSS